MTEERFRDEDELAARHDALTEKLGRPLGLDSFNPRCPRCRDAHLPSVIVGES